MKLIIINKLTEWIYVGYGETLLECVYDLSNEEIKEGLFFELSESYAEDEMFYNDDGEFLEDAYNAFIEELSNSKINDRLYSWCKRNNYYYIEED